MINDLIRDKWKEIVKLQDIIETCNLSYKWKSRKIYHFSEYSFSIVFLKDVHEGHLSLENADDVLSNLAAKFKNLDKSKKTIEKELF